MRVVPRMREKGSMTPTPVALFVYNRPLHTRRTLEALAANTRAAETDLYVFSDAPKSAAAEASVEAVRAVLRTIAGFRSVHVTRRESNLGLARSIISGVTDLCGVAGRVIVLEDDLLTSPHFLEFMNAGLELYKDEPKVATVCGYMYPARLSTPDQTVFLSFPISWGWATWARAWREFEPDGELLLRQLQQRGLVQGFDKQGPWSFLRMLRGQIAGQNDSWLVRWHASTYLRGRITLAPVRSLVSNIGVDGTGVHCAEWRHDPFAVEVSATRVDLKRIPVVARNTDPGLRWFFRRARLLRYLNACDRVVRVWLRRMGRFTQSSGASDTGGGGKDARSPQR